MGYGKVATIVLDTSAVLAALELIQQLYERARPYNVDLLLPITTLKELDRIKDREKFSGLGARAREAINWINKTLTAEDVDAPVIRGQRQVEVLTPGLKADDAILDCCMYNAVHMRNLTILMSDDHNLRSRALAERLETLDSKGMSAGQILEAIRERTVGFMDLDEPTETLGTILGDNAASLRQNNASSATAHRNISQNSTVDGAMRYSTPENDPNSTANQEFEDAEMMEDDNEVPAEPFNGSGLETSRWNATNNYHGNSHTVERHKSAQRRPSKSIHKGLVRPIHAEGVVQTLEQNVAALADWHLRREHSSEDLELLGYQGPPTNWKATFNLIKQYYVPVFRYIVSRTTFDRLAAFPRLDSPESIAAWKQLLLELAQKDTEYVSLVTSLRE